MIVLILLLLCALVAVPMAYVLLWVARSVQKRGRVGEPPWCERCGYSLAGLDARAPCPECGRVTTLASQADWKRRRNREGAAPWCAECGYSLAGLPSPARCPECVGAKGEEGMRPWPTGWTVACWVGLSQLPPVIGALRVSGFTNSGSGLSAIGVAALFVLVVVPGGLAWWAAWVVSRAGMRWLGVATLVVLAGPPLLLGGAAVLTAKPGSGGFLIGPEFGLILAILVGPVVTVLSLALFSVCAAVTAGGMETTTSRRV